MRMRKYFLLLVLLSFLFQVRLISQSERTLWNEGKKSMKELDYFSASQYFNQLMSKDSTNKEYMYSYANASRLNFDNDLALHWYLKLNKVDNGRNFPEVSFYIGEILKSKSDYKQAKKYFNKYTSKNKKSKNADIKKMTAKATLESESCDVSLLLIQNPIPITVEHLDTVVNSPVSEYAPVEMDSILYFSSLRGKKVKQKNKFILEEQNKIYSVSMTEGKWNHLEALDSIINKNKIHTANITFNKNYSIAIFSQCQQINASKFRCKLFSSEYNNGKWSNPAILSNDINLEGTNNTQPCICNFENGSAMFFSSDRAGGQGGMDIWYSKIANDGTYSNPVNAGSKINSDEDEITPYFEDALNMLYFSSNHHKGMGGFDIFKSEYEGGGFTVPENAGYPINSSLNDVYYSINKSKNRAYLSSNRPGSYFEEKQSCCNDIYSFPITPLIIKDTTRVDTVKRIINKMRLLVPLTLFFHNDEPDPKTIAITTKKNYKATCEAYLKLQPTYLSEYPKGLSGDDQKIAQNRVESFFEDSVQSGLNDLEKFALLLEDVLAKNKIVKITMKGFCSPLASTDYNVNLAKRRISSLQNYFRQYKDGMFVKYIDAGKLIFFEEHIGELPKSRVSDDYYDTRNSVYSPFAAAERKIQIIAVSLEQ